MTPSDTVPDLPSGTKWGRSLDRLHATNEGRMTPRRIRVAYVHTGDILQAFLHAGTGFPAATGEGAVNQLQRLRLEGVPVDATVDHVFYDGLRDAFGLGITHPSFAEVPLGEVPPIVACNVHVFMVDGQGKPLRSYDTWRDRPPLA